MTSCKTQAPYEVSTTFNKPMSFHQPYNNRNSYSYGSAYSSSSYSDYVYNATKEILKNPEFYNKSIKEVYRQFKLPHMNSKPSQQRQPPKPKENQEQKCPGSKPR